MSNNIGNKIIERLPYLPSFLFVDEISHVDQESIIGHYTFSKTETFYNSHFKHKPITPGIILIEMMGQIGLVSHLVFLNELHNNNTLFHPILSYVESDFYKEVQVEERLTIIGKKIYLRNGLIKSKIELYDTKETLCTTLTAQLKLVIDK